MRRNEPRSELPYGILFRPLVVILSRIRGYQVSCVYGAEGTTVVLKCQSVIGNCKRDVHFLFTVARVLKEFPKPPSFEHFDTTDDGGQFLLQSLCWLRKLLSIFRRLKLVIKYRFHHLVHIGSRSSLGVQ